MITDNFPMFLIFVSFVILAFASFLGYTFYMRSEPPHKQPFDDTSLVNAIELSTLDVSDIREFGFTKAREAIGKDVSLVVEEPYDSVILDKFLEKLVEYTNCKIESITGEYKYGNEKVKLLKGIIGDEQFVLMIMIDSVEKERVEKRASNYEFIKKYLRKTRTGDNDNLAIPYITSLSMWCKPASLHIKAERVKKALTDSLILWKPEPLRPQTAIVYTLSFDGKNNELSLSPIKTNRFNYNYEDFNRNYEDVSMDILGYKTKLSATECLEYCMAALENSQNCMVVGKPGIGKTVFATAVITKLSKIPRESATGYKFRVILLDAGNIHQIQTKEFTNCMQNLSSDRDDVINLFYMEDADALNKLSFDKDGNKTPFGSFFLSFLSGTNQKMYNAVWLVSSNDDIAEYNDIMRRRFQIVMPFSELSLEKAEEKAKEVSEKETTPNKNSFNWAIWDSIKTRKIAAKQNFTLADIYSCIQPVSATSKFAEVQKLILEKKNIPLEIANAPKVEEVVIKHVEKVAETIPQKEVATANIIVHTPKLPTTAVVNTSNPQIAKVSGFRKKKIR